MPAVFRWFDRLLRRAPAADSASQPFREDGLKPRALLTETEWRSLRAPERHRDRTLSDRARRWMEGLPEDVRPLRLAERYPRIVNQFAVCWGDAGIADFLFYDLTVDRRGTRQGFAAEIKAEIERLREFHEARQMAAEDAPDRPPRAA